MTKRYALLSACLLAATGTFAQERLSAPDTRNCGSMEVLEQLLQANPGMQKEMDKIEQHTAHYLESKQYSSSTDPVLTIPVVVHVVYNSSAENVSATMIQNQINVLNQDFAKLNAEINNTAKPKVGTPADTRIQFCLATVDPNGAPTSGITRTLTSRKSFSSNDWIKYTSQGGKDAWPANKYLNLWVGNLSRGLLGYAQFPGGPAATDGVVILYSSLPGGSAANYNKGRTATHEVGHWLNLRHIWGDATCGNDFVSDTPVHNTSNGGCPAAGHKSTCAGQPEEQWMNYMDYTYDACMYMFTEGQGSRMYATVVAGGPRNSVTTWGGCPGASIAVNELTPDQRIANATEPVLYPNPVSSEMNIGYTVSADKAPVTIEIYNSLGVLVKRINAGEQPQGRHTYNLQVENELGSLANGAYLCAIKAGDNQRILRFMLAR